MKYFNSPSGVYAFELDQLYLVTADMVEMTKDEVHRHENAADYLTDEEKALLKRHSLPSLSKRQFNLYMYDYNLIDQINALFTNNPREKIEFDSTDKIERNSPTVQAMILALGWTDEQVDAMWEQALTI